ncbi:MAG: hypothetical protein KDA65_08895 [Planctomycetaceae bacterium]|nr:hypothetical protein [Planctomycetaceae bacterium]
MSLEICEEKHVAGDCLPQPLTEQIMDWCQEGVQIDRDRRVVRNVALAGRYSRNGYEYEAQALEDAVTLYEGKPVFLDHAYQSVRAQERSARDLIGSVENVSYRDERVRGDIRVLDTESGRTFLALAESEVDVVGMSHVVLAERTLDRKRVIKIHEVISVDVVVSPATTSGLKEGMSLEGRDLQSRMALPGSYEMLMVELDDQLEERDLEGYRNVMRAGLFDDYLVATATRDDVEVGLVFGWMSEEGSGQLSEEFIEIEIEELELGYWRDREELPGDETGDEKEAPDQVGLAHKVMRLQQECEMLEGELEQARAEIEEKLREAEWMQQIEEAGLPVEAVTEVFREQLAGTLDRERRTELIRERVELWKRARRKLPLSMERINESNEQRNLDEEFVRLVRAA